MIYSICKNFIRSYLRNITQYLENDKIESTSNKIENTFQQIMPKHIKKHMKTEKRTRIKIHVMPMEMGSRQVNYLIIFPSTEYLTVPSFFKTTFLYK